MKTTHTRRGVKPKHISPDDLPNQVRPLRIKFNYTLADVALLVGVTRSSLHQFELQGHGIGKKYQFRLADLFKVTYSELLAPGKNFAEKVRQSLD